METFKNNIDYIINMFDSIAYKYDLLNNLISLGQHNRWKTTLVKLTLEENPAPQTVLDICTGTGDIAFIINKLCKETDILAIDSSKNMLNIANVKKEKNKINKITFIQDNFEENKFKESTFDMVTIGFGLRNLVNREKSIETIYKILKVNGIFASIDLGHPENKFWNKIFKFYFLKFVPILGLIFAKNIKAYSYLPNSLNSWYKQENLKEIILKKGFRKCYFKNLFGGCVAIHIAVK